MTQSLAPASSSFTVVIVPNDRGLPAGKLADAELHFVGGLFDGLKLIGFGVWERRDGSPDRDGCTCRRNVTFPARSYSVNGDRRSFALLRPILDWANTHAVRDAILAAYAAHESRDVAAIAAQVFA